MWTFQLIGESSYCNLHDAHHLFRSVLQHPTPSTQVMTTDLGALGSTLGTSCNTASAASGASLLALAENQPRLCVTSLVATVTLLGDATQWAGTTSSAGNETPSLVYASLTLGTTKQLRISTEDGEMYHVR